MIRIRPRGDDAPPGHWQILSPAPQGGHYWVIPYDQTARDWAEIDRKGRFFLDLHTSRLEPVNITEGAS